MKNPLISKWAAGERTVGVWCSIGNSFSAEAAASAGFDYACVDLQHGVVDYSSMVPMLQAIGLQGVTPIVRVPWPEPWLIMQALDAGALGVVVPLIETAEQAALAVAACRYPPTGIRSFGPTRAAIAHGTAEPDELQRVACILMIETEAGIANLDEITSVPGVDAIYVGPSDLALALGLPPRPSGPLAEHERVIGEILEMCQRKGVVAGIHTSAGTIAQRRLAQGFQMATVGTDAAVLVAGLKAELVTANGGEL
jgi:4-hydroxy-2-oxoheptanedioate aldolase